ncbi:MAG TPA: phosphatidate cytidylyltransferase [Vicinamibacterales bacterium]|nr:phosphatidate cytidylyltransferase [Vicinamibacterales bacterium]
MIRLASGLLLIVLVLATLVWLPPWATVALAAVVAALAAGEVAAMAAHQGARVSPIFVGAAAAIVALAFVVDETGLARVSSLAVVLLSLVVAAGCVVLVTAPDASTLTRAAVALMAPIYAGLPLGALAALRATDGVEAVLLLLVILAVSDSAQYYTGRTFGRRRLAPIISPGKTVEGAVGGIVAAVVVAALVGPRLVDTAGGSAVIFGALGLLLALVGMAGDLFESLLKRGAGVKDSSSLIPGHGGVLDRIDSYLFAVPVYFVFVRCAG